MVFFLGRTNHLESWKISDLNPQAKWQRFLSTTLQDRTRSPRGIIKGEPSSIESPGKVNMNSSHFNVKGFFNTSDVFSKSRKKKTKKFCNAVSIEYATKFVMQMIAPRLRRSN